jgi:hypothetical protein
MIARFSAQEDEVLCLAGHEWIPSVVLSGGADCSARVHDVRMRSGMSTVLTLQGFESDVEVRCNTPMSKSYKQYASDDILTNHIIAQQP